MSFILSKDRDADCAHAFRRYDAYLKSVQHGFAPEAWKLANAQWYYDFGDPRCPHDARLAEVTIIEEKEHTRDQERPVSIRVKLSSAYDGEPLEFFYPKVISYQLTGSPTIYGHCDWRYDEFRIAGSGHILHEIEWCGFRNIGTWIIEASDVLYIPSKQPTP